jgi:hypothetical protein
VEPGEGAFDDPAVAAEAGTVRLPAAGDAVVDAEPVELGAAPAGGVGAVGVENADPLVLDLLEQRQQQLDVLHVGRRHPAGKRQPVAVDDQVVLGTGTAPVDAALARRGAPFFACT